MRDRRNSNNCNLAPVELGILRLDKWLMGADNRMYMHYNYGLDYTVEVFIVCKGKVLLRHHDKYKKWMGVGGHIDPGEDPIGAAKREVMEEVGLEVSIVPAAVGSPSPDGYYEMPTPIAINRHTISPTHDHFTFVFAGWSDSDEVHLPDGPEGQVHLKWASDADLNRIELSPTIRGYAEQALSIVSPV